MRDLKEGKLIRRYFNNKFSADTKRKFAWWMTNSRDDCNMDDVFASIWEECSGQMDTQTLTSLEKLKKEIGSSSHKKESFNHIWHIWAPVAAIAILTIIVGSYWIKGQYSVQGDEYVHISAAYGQNVQISLEDSTTVTINSGSTLVYPSHFKKSHRKVYLVGEANFDVKSDPERPFTVETQCFDVTALGTRFKVSSHSDERTVSTTLAEGKTIVTLSNLYGDNDGQTYELLPNQSFSFNKKSGQITIEDVNAQRLLSWENGNLVFDGEDFSTIIRVLERKFNVVFMCDHMERLSGSYFVRFNSDESLEDILSILNNLSHHFEYRITPEVIYLYP